MNPAAPAPKRPSPVPAAARGRAFTLIEMLVVLGVIGILAALLIPALSPSSARALDGDTHSFLATIENARLTAITHRVKTRILLPATDAPSFGQSLALHAYVTTIFDVTNNVWVEQGKWNRLSQFVAFDPNAITYSDPNAPSVDHNVISTRKTDTMPVATAQNATATTFTGAYLEFLPNGSTSLDPAAPTEAVALADAIVDSNGNFTAKNHSLSSQLTIDPLTGAATVK